MRRLFLAAFGCLGLALLVAQPCSAVGTSQEFSPQAVFELPDRANIDSRCQDAIKFADKASKGTDGISADDAAAAANLFALCYRLPKLNPDQDRQRYLVLCGASSLYLAATKSMGDVAEDYYKKADAVAALLGGVVPDNTNGLKTVSNDQTTRNSSSPEEQLANGVNTRSMGQYEHQETTDARNPHDTGQRLKFTDAASLLRASAAAHLNPPTAEASRAAPKPSISP